MIIKKVIIENYLCYFDKKEFPLSPGLNVILGENGEGKTKFFEAIEWLFRGDDRGLDLLVSAKALARAGVGGEFRVRVAITVEQYDETKIITKSFVVKKVSEKEMKTSGYALEGIEENKKGERSLVDGKQLLDSVFPPEIRKYSMFKGESELDIFKNEDALMTLINSFSNAKHYEKYAVKGAFLRERAEKAVDEETRNNAKVQQEYKRLESEIESLAIKRDRINTQVNMLEEQLLKIEENIDEAGKFFNNADALKTINSRIKEIEDQISSAMSKIDERYTTLLFDDKWILAPFEVIHQEFSKKIAALSAKKRALQSEFDKQEGIKEGKRLATSALLNDSIPLPAGVPSKAHMEEMLKDEVCKVCGRPAKEGSEAYVFMQKRLAEYLKSQTPVETKGKQKPVLFPYNYMDRLVNLANNHEDRVARLREIEPHIKDLFEFNMGRMTDIERLEEKLADEQSEKDKLIGGSTEGEEHLSNIWKNFKGWEKDRKGATQDLADYKVQLKQIEDELKRKKEEKDKVDTTTVNKFLINTRAILRDIETIFKDTKERKFDEFIEKLQGKSNAIFETINLDAFTGTIVFLKRPVGSKTTVQIDLQDSEGNKIYKPNQSLQTSMHISILFAISELAAEQKEEKFPMLFDAPTSSFGETKTRQFLNLIHSTDGQKILLIKDFLKIDPLTKQVEVKEEFGKVGRDKAFLIRLQRPFEKKDLKTLDTQIIEL